MNQARNLLAVAFSILLLGVLIGCRSGETADGRPVVLHYVLHPSEEEMQDNSVEGQHMAKYLEEQLHIPVEIISVSGYAPTIEAMRADKVDIASFGPAGYLLAAQTAGAQAIVSAGDKDGRLASYKSVIVVPKNSALRSLEDLKVNSRNLVFSFTDPASTSGNLIPRAYLQSVGIDPERDFKKVVFVGSHVAVALTVDTGKVDAGTMMESIIPRLISLGKLSPGDLRILWTSAPIPYSPITVRKALPDSLKEQIRQALLAIPVKDPTLWKMIKASYGLPQMTFTSIDDSAYDGLRNIAAKVRE